MIHNIRSSSQSISFLDRIPGFEGSILNEIPMSINAINAKGFCVCGVKILMPEIFYNEIYKNMLNVVKKFINTSGGNYSIYYTDKKYLDLYIAGYSVDKNSDVRKFFTLLGREIKELLSKHLSNE